MTLTLMPEEPSGKMQNAAWSAPTSRDGPVQGPAYKAMREHAPKLNPLVWVWWRPRQVFYAEDPFDPHNELMAKDDAEKAERQAEYERRVRELFG